MRQLIRLPGTDPRSLTPLDRGIAPGVFAYTGHLWADGENVVFRDNGVMSMRGWSQLVLFGQRARVLGQVAVPEDLEGRVYLGTDGGLYAWQSSIGLSTLAVGYSGGSWSLVEWGLWLIATNGVDLPQIWKNNYMTAPTALDTSAAGFTKAKIVRKFGPHVIFFNTDKALDGPAHIVWSGEDDPEEWDITDAATLSGDLTIRDMESEIIAVVPLGDALALYSADGMALLEHSGGQYVFGVTKLFDNIGAVSKNSVVSVGKHNFGFGPQGIWQTDGVSAKYVDDPAMRRWLQENFDRSAGDRVAGYNDELEQQVIFYFPGIGETENTLGVGYNYATGAWSKFNFGRSAALSRSVFSYPLTAGDTKIYLQGDGILADGVPLSCWVQSRPMDMNKPELYKRIQHVHLAFEGNMTLELGAGENNNAVDEWFYSAAAATRNPIMDRETPFVTLKFVGDGTMKLTGVGIDGEVGGYTV